ncbi:MAG: hypothetical protein KC560_19790 [Myxococcales bacterium]|nr:hypothetical protein [Myxococcales bacterium]
MPVVQTAIVATPTTATSVSTLPTTTSISTGGGLTAGTATATLLDRTRVFEASEPSIVAITSPTLEVLRPPPYSIYEPPAPRPYDPTPTPYDPPPPPGTPPPEGGGADGANGGGTGGAPQGDGKRWSLDQQLQVYAIFRDRIQELQQLRREREARKEQEAQRRQDFQGPSALGAANLLENLHVDRRVELRANEILKIASEVYFDANRDTGVVYYLPRRYDLAWNPRDQYALTVIYGMAGATEGDGEVFMAARLDTGIDARELEVAKALVRAYIRRHAKQTPQRFEELRPVPLASTSNVELFGGASNEFTVDAGQVSVQRVSGFLESIDVSWATDVRRLLNIESLLRTDAGIHGSTTFETAGREPFRRTIPLEIDVTSRGSLGRVVFDRAKGWANDAPYPVTLHDLHALVLATESRGRVREDDPVVYSWSLGDAVVAPGERVRWQAGAVPEWLDGQALLFWVEYSVDGTCAPCDDAVFSERFIPDLPKTREVVFTTGDAFEATGAERITVHVRSPFLDPQRSAIVQLPGVRLAADGQETQVARLFLTEREFSPAASHEPFYEWFLEVAMRDGTTYRSPSWSPSRALDLLLGSAVVEQALGGRVWERASPNADDAVSPSALE